MKTNKITIVVSPDREVRAAMIKRLVVDAGFAKTPGDAAKIIRKSPYDFDLSESFFVFAELYNLRESPITTHKLYEMAVRGLAVIVGARRIPPEMEFLCSAQFP